MTVRKRTTLLVVHVTATPPTLDIGVKEVRAMHKARGWSDIGYHFVIRRDGTIERGRPENEIGAHVAGFNSTSLGISMVGGVDATGKAENNATPAQYAALETLLRSLSVKYSGAKVCGHRDLSPDGDGDGVIEPGEWIKACPCFDAIPWAASKGLPAASIRGAWSTKDLEGAGVIGLTPPHQSQPSMAAGAPDARNVYLQRLLARAGYQFGPIDGVIGKRTKAALKAFQTSTGLSITQQFDPQTVAKLRGMFEAAA